MKISPRDIESYLKNPAAKTRTLLLFGPDHGLVDERARHVLAGLVDDITDPFQVVALDAKPLDQDPGKLVDEALSFSMLGGPRAIRVRAADNKTTPAIEQLLSSGPTGDFVVVEAGELTAKSSLRKLYEKSDLAAVVACYGDEGGGLARVIQETLAVHRLKADTQAMDYLSRCLGGDRRVVRNEVEKLALYALSDKGDADAGFGTITLQQAMACIGDNTEAAVDKIVAGVFSGNYIALDRAIESSFTEGANAVTILRAIQRHLQQLLAVNAHMAQGKTAQAAVAGLRPPVFYKIRDKLAAEANRWNLIKITRAIDITIEAENDAKTTGLPANLICHRALMRITQAAGRR